MDSIMKPTRIFALVAVTAFTAGFWSGCTVGTDLADHEFSCTDNSDCISPNVCRSGVCTRADTDIMCTDQDGDGYGAAGTDVTNCDLCENQGRCEEDCNDDDASISPGLGDACDGIDNNCNDEIDEPTPCESSVDCSPEGSFLLSCGFDSKVCEYKVPLQGGECPSTPVACENGTRGANLPDTCF